MKRLLMRLLFGLSVSIFVSCDALINITYPEEVKQQNDTIIHFTTSFEYTWKGINRTLTDNGVLLLPLNYRNNKETTTHLIIYCHSGGGSVQKTSSECEHQDVVKYLVSSGFAVLSMASMPEDLALELAIDQFRTVGSDVAIRATIAGFNYITKKYSFRNYYLLSNSNGGLLASNLVHFSNIPFKAQSGIAPLLSIEKNAWLITAGCNSGGLYQRYQNRANIISLYDMKPCSNQYELDAKAYEKEKVGEYDPFDYYIVNRKASYKVPYLIFSCIDDTTTLYEIASEFASVVNETGCYAKIDTTSSLGAHSAVAHPIIVGSFSYRGKEYPTNEVYVKIRDFFNQYI